MFKNYFKIAWRNLLKDRRFSLLNLSGLATGLACALLIFLWAEDERRVGNFDENDNRRFEVMHNAVQETNIETGEPTPGLLAESLAKEIPETEKAVSVMPTNLYDKEGILYSGDLYVRANRIMAGKDYFNVFPFRLIDGNRDLVLTDKYSIVISKKLALQLFKSTEGVVGKNLRWNQINYSGNYVVSGIFETPENYYGESFDVIFNYQMFLDKYPQKAANWENSDASTFVLLKKGASMDVFNSKMTRLVKSKNEKTKDNYFLQRYSDKYLYNHYENGNATGGRIEYVKLFSLVALFILAIACINFTNLSTAKASQRVTEVGIKKVMGAHRNLLIIQYLGESLLLTFISLLMAMLLVILLIPEFNNITGKTISFHPGIRLILSFAAIGLFTGLIAGSYPALYLSGFKPITALKGKIARSASELFVRKGLVIFQFVLSIVFIVSVMVIYQQVNLIQTRNLGYSRDHVILFEKGGLVSDSSAYYKDGGGYETELENFLTRIRTIPGVVNAANYRHDITNRQGGTSDISWEGSDPDKKTDFTDLAAGYGFIETLGIQMAAGRSFSSSFGNEKSKVIFNETAIRIMGIRNPVGKTVKIWGENKEIIGVAKDFNFQSLHENIKPCFFDFNFNHWASKIMVRISAGAERETIARLQKFYKENNNGLALDYRFLDDDYQLLYASENRIALLSRYFAFVAILITGLGLFGLAAFTAQRRQKEISIRKVSGATEAQLVLLLSKDFLQLVLMAILIAFPIAGWATVHWLNGFAYRVSIGVSLYLVSGLLIILVTLITISFQTISTAMANPARSLRSE